MAEDSKKPKRRVVKKVDSLREATEKATNAGPKGSSILRQALYYISVPFRFIGRPLKKPAKRIGRIKVMRILGKILWPVYFRNSWKELKQVTWPTRRESWQLTGAVLLFSTIFGVMIALVDFLLDKLFKEVLLK